MKISLALGATAPSRCGQHRVGGLLRRGRAAQLDAAYAFTLGNYRRMLEKGLAAGITKPFLHGLASQDPDAPWPSQSRISDFVAGSWNDRRFPERANWRPLTGYSARGTAVLETGVPRTGVAIYRDGFLTTAARGIGDAHFAAPTRLVGTEALEIEVRTPLRSAVVPAGTSPNLGDTTRARGLLGPVRLLATLSAPSASPIRSTP